MSLHLPEPREVAPEDARSSIERRLADPLERAPFAPSRVPRKGDFSRVEQRTEPLCGVTRRRAQGLVEAYGKAASVLPIEHGSFRHFHAEHLLEGEGLP